MFRIVQHSPFRPKGGVDKEPPHDNTSDHKFSNPESAPVNGNIDTECN